MPSCRWLRRSWGYSGIRLCPQLLRVIVKKLIKVFPFKSSTFQMLTILDPEKAISIPASMINNICRTIAVCYMRRMLWRCSSVNSQLTVKQCQPVMTPMLWSIGYASSRLNRQLVSWCTLTLPGLCFSFLLYPCQTLTVREYSAWSEECRPTFDHQWPLKPLSTHRMPLQQLWFLLWVSALSQFILAEGKNLHDGAQPAACCISKLSCLVQNFCAMLYLSSTVVL